MCAAHHLSSSYCFRLHGIAVSNNAEYFYDHCNETLREVGMGHIKAEDLFRMVDGYKGEGYGISTFQELGKPTSQPVRAQPELAP
jgi:hypothetical protein